MLHACLKSSRLFRFKVQVWNDEGAAGKRFFEARLLDASCIREVQARSGEELAASQCLKTDGHPGDGFVAKGLVVDETSSREQR